MVDEIKFFETENGKRPDEKAMNTDKYKAMRLEREGMSAAEYQERYEDFKLGYLLRDARINKGMTQQELAEKIETTKSAISRLENHAEDMKLSTLNRVANALDMEVHVSIR